MSKKITDLPVASSLNGSDKIEIVNAGVSKSATISQLASLAGVVPAIGAFSTRPASPVSGQLFYPTDGGYAQIFDGTSWWNIIGGVPVKQPPTAATLSSQWNFGTSSLTNVNGQLIFQPQVNAATSMRGACKAITTLSAASVTVSAAINCAAPFAGIGPVFRESATGKILALSMISKSTGTTFSFGYTWATWASPTSRNGSPAPISFTFQDGQIGFIPPVMRMRVSGSNIISETSVDGGLNFVTLATIATTSAFTTAPDQFGIGAYVENNTNQAIHSISGLSFTG